MWWRTLAALAVLVIGGPAAAQPPADALHDATIVSALGLLGIPRAAWPQVAFPDASIVADDGKDLARFAAFRLRKGTEVDPHIYVNRLHRFYLEARDGGSDMYPLFRLASVLRHEMQHGESEHGEATALAVQARFLRTLLIRLQPERRSEAMAYIQSLEGTVTVARAWDRTGEYPGTPR